MYTFVKPKNKLHNWVRKGRQDKTQPNLNHKTQKNNYNQIPL